MDIIKTHYNSTKAESLFNSSYLLQYLEKKTKSVDRSSKARGSFANIYAIYVLTEDYVNKGYNQSGKNYSSYGGMSFTDALTRTRKLPFGEKIQNHALNDRCNDEFKKFFINSTNAVPIIRNLSTKKYWINEALLIVNVSGEVINISSLCIEIINKYIYLKMKNFSTFFYELNSQKDIVEESPDKSISFIAKTLNPNSDARIFEIASYVIIKYYYIDQKITYTDNDGKVITQHLTVFKVGRTNANDGGIDYIMKPFGRIFQVTEDLNFKKYFLDIDKLIHYPIVFVVKKNISPQEVMSKIKQDAESIYSADILANYLKCFEEIITIPVLMTMLTHNVKNGYLKLMIDEFINQCKVEYNL